MYNYTKKSTTTEERAAEQERGAGTEGIAKQGGEASSKISLRTLGLLISTMSEALRNSRAAKTYHDLIWLNEKGLLSIETLTENEGLSEYLVTVAKPGRETNEFDARETRHARDTNTFLQDDMYYSIKVGTVNLLKRPVREAPAFHICIQRTFREGDSTEIIKEIRDRQYKVREMLGDRNVDIETIYLANFELPFAQKGVNKTIQISSDFDIHEAELKGQSPRIVGDTTVMVSIPAVIRLNDPDTLSLMKRQLVLACKSVANLLDEQDEKDLYGMMQEDLLED